MEPWKKLRETVVYDRWRKLIQKEFLLPDGKTAVFDVIGNNPYVTVAAFTANKEAIVTQQFRPGPEMELVSFAEGYIEKGESPETAGRRELLEETGYAAGQTKYLSLFRRAYTTDRQHVIVAWDCEKTGELNLDENEFIQTKLLPLPDFKQLLLRGEEPGFANIGPAYQALVDLNWI